MSVAIVTDSLADLPPSLAQEMGIRVVPLNVHFGTESYRDGVDISADEFYARLPQSTPLPKTSAPSTGDFVEAYREGLKKAEAVVSIHASTKLSGTYNSAMMAKQHVVDEWKARGKDGKTPPDIRVVDTAWVSMGEGMMAVVAARAAKAGAGADEVEKAVQDVRSRTRCAILVDTLDYLVKGGRIGKAQGFVGSLLKLKPLLEIREGEVHPLERVRTYAKAYERLHELAARNAPMESVAVVYSTTPQEAKDLLDRLKGQAQSGCAYIAQIGPVVGTYAGPGCVAVMWVEGKR